MRKIGINCDMGEAFGIYRFGNDEACMPYVTHVNIACGFHASDPVVMWDTVQAAKRHRVKIGAHPGLPDREGFGRREMKITRREATAMTLYQTGALKSFLEAEGLEIDYIKPHGSLFGMAQKQEDIAEGIADAAEALGLPVIAYSNCCMSEVFTRRGIAFTCEFYADLQYTADGRQIITRSHGAFDVSRLADKIRRAVLDGKTTAIDGTEIDVVADTICVHSDGATALDVARTVHETLRELNMLEEV